MNDPTMLFRVRGTRQDILTLMSQEVISEEQIWVNHLELIHEGDSRPLDEMIAVGSCTKEGAIWCLDHAKLEILQMKHLD